MNSDYKTLLEAETEGYYEEKKSKFMAFLIGVTTESEIEENLDRIRKTHYNANHHCYAYILGKDRGVKKCSDDGEPQKTAGMPILSILEGAEITNVLCVVVRYFGGTLLGTGGLTRAYSSAAKDALAHGTIIEKCQAEVLKITVDYTTYGKLQYYLSEQGYVTLSETFEADVTVKVPIKLEETQLFVKEITNLSQGKAKITKERDVFFAKIGKEVRLFQS